MNENTPEDCIAASARALQHVMARGHLYLDDMGGIVTEYRGNLSASGQPGPGDVFLKWVLTHEWSGIRVTRVVISPDDGEANQFKELPKPLDGTSYDPSDRKFLAVAAAHPAHPVVLQSFDSKWWGWPDALAHVDVSIHFLCPEAIEAKFQQKMA